MKSIKNFLKSDNTKDYLLGGTIAPFICIMLAILDLFLYGINDILNNSSCSVVKELYVKDLKVLMATLIMWVILWAIVGIIIIILTIIKPYLPKISEKKIDIFENFLAKWVFIPIERPIEWIWNKTPKMPRLSKFLKDYLGVIVLVLILALILFYIFYTILTDLCI